MLVPTLKGMSTMDLQDRKAQITGGTSGIGIAVAISMAEKGAAAVVTGRDETRGAFDYGTSDAAACRTACAASAATQKPFWTSSLASWVTPATYAAWLRYSACSLV